MARVKRGTTTHKRREKVLSLTKGYRGRAKNCMTVAIERSEKGLQYAYRDRKNRKREFRKLWIQRINAAARLNGMVYSQFMNGLHKAGIEIDRKVLSDIAIHDAAAFSALAKQSEAALSKAA